MAVRDVLLFPHPTLKRTARALGTHGRDEAERVASDLLDTMAAHAGCVGLAAPQLDELVRMVVVDVTEHPKAETSNGLLLLIDPEVVSESGAEVAREGCLSIPHLTSNVRRATAIEVRTRTPTGEAVELRSEGFEAR